MNPVSSARSVIAYTMTLTVLLLCSAVLLATDDNPKITGTPDELVLRGQYFKVSVGDNGHHKAMWAFARHQIAPSGKVYDAAWEAHLKGEPLGTFVVWLCHKEGVGTRFDEKLMWRLQFELRTSLEKKQNPTPLELFVLSQLDPTDINGVIKAPEKTDYREFTETYKKRQRERLEAAASAGCAQACFKIGEDYQGADDIASALKWYTKAAEIGHAGAMRSKGYLLMVGEGVQKDPKAAFDLAAKAAKRGDAFAMVNLAVYHDRGWGVEVSKEKAQEYLDRAVESGHWVGRTERAMARLHGMYGYAVDKKAGEEDLRAALALRSRDVLNFLASAYAEGNGVAQDGNRAVRFAEAAFVQGSTNAARLLASLYEEGVGGLNKDEKLKQYWSVQANPNFAFTFKDDLQKMQPELTERLKKLDPWIWGE